MYMCKGGNKSFRAVNSRTLGGAGSASQRRRSTLNKNRNSSTKLQPGQPEQSSEHSEEQKMAIVLFFIVALYLGMFTSLISH